MARYLQNLERSAGLRPVYMRRHGMMVTITSGKRTAYCNGVSRDLDCLSIVTCSPLLVQLRGGEALDNVQAIDFELLNDRTQWEEGKGLLRGHVDADWIGGASKMQVNL